MKHFTCVLVFLLLQSLSFGGMGGYRVNESSGNGDDSLSIYVLSKVSEPADTSLFVHVYLLPLNLIGSNLSSIDIGVECNAARFISCGFAANRTTGPAGYEFLAYGDVYWNDTVFRPSIVSSLSLGYTSQLNQFVRSMSPGMMSTVSCGVLIGYKHFYRDANSNGSSFGAMLGGEFYRIGVTEPRATGFYFNPMFRLSVGYIFGL